MDSMEYSSLLSTLDRQLDTAKREAEVQAKREEMEQRVKLLDHWIEGLEKKKAELAQYRIEPEIDIDETVSKMTAEKIGIQARLNGQIERQELSREQYQEMKDLLDEITQGFLPDDAELCWWTFEMWALRWRTAAETLSEGALTTNGFMKKIFAKIREAMKLQPSMQWFIRALGKEKADVNWKARLEECWAGFKKRQEEVKRQKAERNAADDAIVALTQAFVAYRDGGDPESERKLRHHIRDAAKYAHLRDEIVLVVTPLKAELEKEFGFLWAGPKEKEEEAPSKKVTNREILSKLLRRMKAKTLIGASHGPYEQIYKGFAAHDIGRAKEGLDILIHAGVIKTKDSVIGQRVSIYTALIPKVDSFVNGEPMGLEEVDGWASPEN